MMETVPSVLMAFLNTPMKKVRDEEARLERAGGAGGLSDGGVFQATHVGILLLGRPVHHFSTKIGILYDPQRILRIRQALLLGTGPLLPMRSLFRQGRYR